MSTEGGGRLYRVKDAGGVTIRSRTLYQIIAKSPSLEERHRTMRNNFILAARQSSNFLIRTII